MLGHVSIHVLDLEASLQFYLTTLSPLSYRAVRFPSVIGLGSTTSNSPIPDLWLRQHTPDDRNSHAEKPTPVHISFYVKEQRLVDEFHAAGINAGGKDNGKPGVRPWMEGYYAAYVLDLDGNNIEVVYFGTKMSAEH